MATHDYVIANGTGAAVRSDLNNALAAIVSNNSGSSEPATTYAYQWWADTTANVLKIRNSANNAWITLRELDGTMLIEDGSASTPGLAFADDTNTGIFSGAADQVGFATGGAERLKLGNGEAVFNDISADTDFRVESNGQTHMLFVDAGNDRVGVGTTSPATDLEVTASAPEVRISSSNTGQTAGSSVGKLSFYTSDPTTPGGAGVAASIETLSSTSNGSDYQLLINKREGSGGGSSYINLGTSSTGAITFGTATSGTGSEKVRVDSSGRFLVGTSSTRSNIASTAQDVVIERASIVSQSLVANQNASGGSTLSLCLSRGTSVGSNTVVQSGDTVGVLAFRGNDGTNFLNLGMVKGEVDGSPSTNDMPGRLTFYTTADSASSPTERVRIDSSGNLTLKTTSSAGKFIFQEGSNNAWSIDSNGANGYLRFYDEYNNSEALQIDNSGRVLIGTTASDQDARLTVARTGNGGTTPSSISTATVATFRATGGLSHEAHVSILSGSTGASKLNFGDRDDEDVGSVRYNHSSNFMEFATNTTTCGRFTNNGRFDVFATSATDAMFVSSGASAGTAIELFRGMHSATAIAGGTTSLRIYTNGDIQNTNNNYDQISDVKLKENIVDANSQWDDIKAVQIRNYNFKEETGHQTHTQIGVVAQELETVSPGLVYETPDLETVQVPVLDENGEPVLDENGQAVVITEERDTGTVTKAVHTSVLYMKAVKALQEAMDRIETLETKVAALEAG